MAKRKRTTGQRSTKHQAEN